MGENTGILHPGEMGIPTATYAQNSGHIVFWPSHGRSSQTRESVQRHALVDLHSLETLCETCSIIVSVCPPHLGAR